MQGDLSSLNLTYKSLDVDVIKPLTIFELYKHKEIEIDKN